MTVPFVLARMTALVTVTVTMPHAFASQDSLVRTVRFALAPMTAPIEVSA
jgi:hypothetical protein